MIEVFHKPLCKSDKQEGKMKILVSACLLGTPCRYDGRAVPNEDVIALGQAFELVPFCPEVTGGLSTPRTPAERRGNVVITKDGRDVTAEYVLGAEKALDLAKRHGCKTAVLKEKSPSCGCGKIYDGTFSGRLINGIGVTAQILKEAGIDVIGESEIKKLLQKGRQAPQE